jgi:hypothetical protein
MHAVAAAPAPSTPPAPDLVARRWFNPPDSIRRIRRARFVAATNGGLLAAGAFVSLLLALGDPWSAVPGLVLAVFAFFEFQGRAALARLDPSAPRRLAINQIALGIVLGLYFAWRTIDTSRRPPTIPAEFQSLGDPELDRAFAESWRTMLPIMIGAYATVAIGSLIACGLNAWYYASRRRWVLEARNATATPRPHGAA